jgi:DNA-binding HxlR family transcriptional regulator
MLLPKRKLRRNSIFFSRGVAPYWEAVDPEHALCATYLVAMGVLAKPWNGLIIAVLEEGPLRFSELSARLPAIGDRMLAARLKELGSHGLVARAVEPGPPVRVCYTLTEVGRGFHDVADAIRRWGQTILAARERAPESKRSPRARPRAQRSG